MTVNLYLNDVLKDTRTVTLSQQGDSVTLTWPGLHSVTISLANGKRHHACISCDRKNRRVQIDASKIRAGRGAARRQNGSAY